MKFKRLVAALLSATLMISLAACSGNEKPAESQTREGTTAEAIHVNLAESWGFEYFYTIITPDVSSSTGYDITYYLTSFYDTLVTYNENNELVGSLAEDWSMSDDGKVYTFHIKEGIKFSDGSDLTAEDVAKSLMAVPVNLGQYNGGYGRLSTIIESAEATDDYTVELRLTQPYYNTLRELCLANPFGIVSSEQLGEDLKAKDTFKTATYGTGPYMYEGDNDGQTWNFVRNPNYWGEEPEVDSFSIKNIPDNDAKILALKNGEIDFISGIKNVSAESYDEISQTEGFGAKIDEKALQTYYVGYNLNDTIFGDQVIREAISAAIDQDSLETMNHEAVEYIRGISVLKVFGQTVQSITKFNDAIKSYRKFALAYTMSCKKGMVAFNSVINSSFLVLVPTALIIGLVSSDLVCFTQSFLFYVIFSPACAVMLNKILYMTSYKMQAEESMRRIDMILTAKTQEETNQPKHPKSYDVVFEDPSTRNFHVRNGSPSSSDRSRTPVISGVESLLCVLLTVRTGLH